MNVKILLVLSLMCSGVGVSKNYGATVKGNNPLMLSEAIKSDGSVLTTGTVDQVCQKKGCWLSLKDSKTRVRVKFKDYAFFVPTSLIGKKVVVKGSIVRKVTSIEEQKHYLKDAGKPQKQIDAVTKEKKTVTILASGVKVI